MERILIVDDQEFKYRDIYEIFDTQKIIIDWAADYFSYVQKIRSHDYSLILLDVTFNEQVLKSDNLGAIAFLNYLELNEKSIPVVLITQYMEFDSNIQSNEYKFDSYYAINKNYGSDNADVVDFKKNILFLPNLHEYLCYQFEFYAGCVLYKQNTTMWKKQLEEIIITIGGKERENIIVR